MKKKVLCFGELLLRISPAAYENVVSAPFLLYIGGAEANAATALAGWRVPVEYCTVLPDNFMSAYMVNYLEYRGIYTSSILLSGDRTGVYYLDRGADLKSNVVYDRERSSFSELKIGMIDWDKVLQDVSWFHFTAISPALNQTMADVCLEAVEVASRKNITISVDLNYRSRLWKYGKDPQGVMPALVAYCDLVMGNIWSANSLLGTAIDPAIHAKGNRQAYLDHAERTSKEIISRFPKCKSVANTFRFDSDTNDLLYYTTLFTGKKQYNSAEFRCRGVIDRSGSGDCFMAGLIYGFYHQHKPVELLNYATAAAFGKLQEAGDSTGQDALQVAAIKFDNINN